MKNSAVICVSVAPIYREPFFSSEMVTQCLLWDSVKLVKSKNNWYKIQKEEGYSGWIHSFYLCKNTSSSSDGFYIAERNASIFINPNNPENIQMTLSFGTWIPFVDRSDDIVKILLPNENYSFMKNKINIYKNNRKNLRELAKLLIGVPYLWGGASSFGYDCSGFVQAILKVMDVKFKRDTNGQIKEKKLKEIDINEAESGDLIYFSKNNRVKHVAILIENNNIIHCSGQVKIESLFEGKKNYNRELNELDKICMSVANLIEN